MNARHVQQVVRRIACYDFPWDVTRSLELALFRTFASPRIGGLLHATGEFEARPQKRYDDTDLIVSEIIENGFESERGQRAIARMNAIHGRFAICNEDFLYVLSTFVFEPIHWIDRFGWRGLSAEEAEAWFCFWREVGRRMNLSRLPADRESFHAFSRAYEAQYFQAGRAGQGVARATRELFASWFPAPLRPLVRLNIHALLDDSLREAFGFPQPAPPIRWLAPALLRARARLLRILPRRRTPHLRTRQPHPSYPAGYEIEALGTSAVPPQACPRMGGTSLQPESGQCSTAGGVRAGGVPPT